MSTVAILDDDRVTCRLLQSMLRLDNISQIDIFYNISDFRNYLSNTKPDLAILDINIEQKFDGIIEAEFAWNTCGIPVIFITGDTEDETFQRASAVNPFGYLFKPLTKNQVAFSVELAIRNGKLMNHYSSINEDMARKITILSSLSDISHLLTSFAVPMETRLKGIINLISEVTDKWFSSRVDLNYHDFRFTTGKTSAQTLVFKRDFYFPDTKMGSINIYSDQKSGTDNDLLEFMSMVADRISDFLKQTETGKRLEIFEKAIEQSPVAVVITDAVGKVEYTNSAYTQITGYTQSEIENEADKSISTRENLIPSRVKNDLLFGKTWKGEVLNFRKNGDPYWESSTFFPLKTKGGFITHHLGFKEDISEKRQAELRLKESEFLLRHIMDSLKVGYIRFNMETREIMDINSLAAKYTALGPGMTRCSSQNCMLTEFEKNMILRKKIVEPTTPIQQEIELEGGSKVTILKKYIEQDYIGSKFIIEILIDITERITLEQSLSHAQKMESIGNLAAGIAHEINTPSQYVGDNIKFLKDSFNDIAEMIGDIFTLLSNHADLNSVAESLSEKADWEYLKDEIPRALEDGADGISRITKIVRAMKNFSHPGSEDMNPASINDAIESTSTVCRNEWKYVANLELDLEPSNPTINCYIGDLNQVFLNMIVNSAHAIEDKFGRGTTLGNIAISTRLKGPDIEIKIRDDGNGISPENINKIYDHFFTTKKVGKGTGQGLAISYQIIVNKHAGTIDVKSELGIGTEFTISLPLNGKAPS
ncbi:PAS domain S-box protein [Myxococcota bacterium]|nr:PAS domain S-box protein [Myxococcota bacterium]MBU1380758.1 PAS domain S-box protein [Myxococcota bacterium]MBU1497095.1 PAS domain S-box protein [Myxococcota bacterium]